MVDRRTWETHRWLKHAEPTHCEATGPAVSAAEACVRNVFFSQTEAMKIRWNSTQRGTNTCNNWSCSHMIKQSTRAYLFERDFFCRKASCSAGDMPRASGSWFVIIHIRVRTWIESLIFAWALVRHEDLFHTWLRFCCLPAFWKDANDQDEVEEEHYKARTRRKQATSWLRIVFDDWYICCEWFIALLER